MAKSPKICHNKDCGKELQPEDQYCESCGWKVSVPPALDWKYLLAAGLVLLIIGIVAGEYVSKNWMDSSNAYVLKSKGEAERSAITKQESSPKDFKNACRFFDEAIASSNAKLAYEEKCKLILHWRENGAWNINTSEDLLKQALASINVTVAIDQNDSESWTYKADILRALGGDCRDYNTSQIYKNEANQCEIRSKLIEGISY